MSIKNLSNEDHAIILQCMKCIFGGPYICEEEFHTRLGINRNNLSELIEHWPEIDDFRSDSSAQLAVNNCLNEVCHGISFRNDDWSNWFNTTRAEIKAVYNRWKESVAQSRTGMRVRLEYFDQNNDFSSILPKTGVLTRELRLEDSLGKWVIFNLDEPFSYQDKQYDQLLLSSRWLGYEIGGKEPTSVFILLVNDPAVFQKPNLTTTDFKHVAWGMVHSDE